jgi:hypothetical protein
MVKRIQLLVVYNESNPEDDTNTVVTLCCESPYHLSSLCFEALYRLELID